MTTEHIFKTKNMKLAIVGSHKGTRDGDPDNGIPGPPYNDESWDVWVFNEAAMNPWVRRWTGVWNIHMEKNLQNTNGIGSYNHWEWLQKDHGEGKVIWTQRVYDEIPNSVAYPLEEMIEKFPPMRPTNDRPFVTSTPSHALALALYLGYQEIGIWGVDLSSNTEYTYQANAWRYWVGVARGILGEDFKIYHGGKHLFVAKIYGYEDDTRVGPDYYKQRVEYHDAYWAKSKKRCGELKDKLVDIIAGKGEPKDFFPMFQECTKAYRDHGECSGAMGEAVRFAERADILHRQEFEWHAAKANEEAQKLQPTLWKAIGHLEYVFNIWAKTGQFDARTQVVQFLDQIMQMSYNLGFMSGKTKENMKYINDFDQRLIVAGGEAVNDEIMAAKVTEVA